MDKTSNYKRLNKVNRHAKNTINQILTNNFHKPNKTKMTILKNCEVLRVENMTSPRGNDVPNQFIIHTNDGKYFQSYNSIIAFIPNDLNSQQVLIDPAFYDYSKTTGKYRNIFLNEDKAETDRKIKEGIYKKVNLNVSNNLPESLCEIIFKPSKH